MIRITLESITNYLPRIIQNLFLLPSVSDNEQNDQYSESIVQNI